MYKTSRSNSIGRNHLASLAQCSSRLYYNLQIAMSFIPNRSFCPQQSYLPADQLLQFNIIRLSIKLIFGQKFRYLLHHTFLKAWQNLMLRQIYEPTDIAGSNLYLLVTTNFILHEIPRFRHIAAHRLLLMGPTLKRILWSS